MAELTVDDESLFIMQQNQINGALNTVREALYKKSEITECIECGDDIPEERKIALPSAEHCIVCATFLEKRKFK